MPLQAPTVEPPVVSPADRDEELRREQAKQLKRQQRRAAIQARKDAKDEAEFGPRIAAFYAAKAEERRLESIRNEQHNDDETLCQDRPGREFIHAIGLRNRGVESDDAGVDADDSPADGAAGD